MTDTPDERPSPQRPSAATGQPAPRDETPAGQRSPREDMGKTPGDGTLQDATPAGLSSEELRKRAEEIDGSAQPGTG